MRVAILSAGPSLTQTFNPDAEFDLRIGVNAAAAVHPVDVWSCGDAQTFARVIPIGTPTLFTMTNADGRYRKRQSTWDRFQASSVVLWATVKKSIAPPKGWSNWSITAALAYAVDRGASEIHVFGHDMSGTVDLAGHDLKKRAENWKRVRADWQAMTEWASRKGVRVEKHQPEAAVCV